MPSAGLDQRQIITSEEIERYRKKLLGLSKRNNLISFRHQNRSARQLRAVDELLDDLFEKLEADAKLSFEPIPLPEVEPDDEKTPTFRKNLKEAKKTDLKYLESLETLGKNPTDSQVHRIEGELRDRLRATANLPPVQRQLKPTAEEVAKDMGINPSFELPGQGIKPKEAKKRSANKKIQTLVFPEILESKVRSVYDHARLTESETGINTLNCAFGFLEWFESDDSDEPILSPILLYPVDLIREEIKNQYSYAIHSRDEEMLVNLPLCERLLKDFEMVLPEFCTAESDEETNDTPETYFKKIEILIEKKKRWKIRRFFTVSFFSFAKLALFQDLNPKNWEEQPLSDNKCLLDLLGGMEDVDKNDQPGNDEVERVDETPLHITDADSSQLAALKEVLRGRSLVIEGPPGTGKSQTITNIIAAVLAQGKTVLFVAEKLAALQVVKNRLDKAGLGDFCLELHSSKTRKAEVLKSFEHRLRRSGWLRSDVESIASELINQENELNQYVNALNTSFGNIGKSLYSVLGSCVRLRSEYPELASLIDGLNLPNVERMSSVEMERQKSLLSACAKAQVRVLEHTNHVQDHPWYGLINAGFGVLEQDKVINTMPRLLAYIKEARQSTNRLLSPFGHTEFPGLNQLNRWISAIESINLDANIPLGLWSQLKDSTLDHRISEALELIRNGSAARELQRKTLGVSIDATQSLVQELNALAKEVEDSGLIAETLIEIQQMANIERNAADTLGTLQSLLGQITRCLDIKLQLSVSETRFILQAIEFAAELSPEAVPYRIPGIVDRQGTATLRAAGLKAQHLDEKRQKLETHFFIHADLQPALIRSYATLIHGATFFSQFERSVREASKGVRTFLKITGKLGRKELSPLLFELAEYLEARQLFQNDAGLKILIGSIFKGESTNFTQLIQVAEWADRVRGAFPSGDNVSFQLREALLRSTPAKFEELRCFSALPSFKEAQVILAKIESGPNDQLRNCRDNRIHRASRLNAIAERLKQIGVDSQFSILALKSSVEAAKQTVHAITTLNADTVLLQALDSDYRGLDTDVFCIEKILLAAKSVRAVGLGEKFEHVIFSSNVSNELKGTKAYAADLSKRLAETEDLLKELETLGLNSQSHSSFEVLRTLPLTQLENRIERAAVTRDGAAYLADFLRDEIEVRQAGIGDILDRFVQNKRGYEELPQAFELAFWQSLAKVGIEMNPTLQHFSGLRHEELVNRFRDLDKRSLTANRAHLVRLLMNRTPPRGNSTGRSKDFTELALIKREVKKTKRHFPLRFLLSRAPASAVTLKPCFMMSPLSVASFLTPQSIFFDVVVMDEASQLRPEDALGAVARAKQVVIVGDSKQLPPSNFFEFADNEEDEDDESDAAANESILDVPKNWPRSRLIWHYRSRHDSLIAFSNRQFYQDELIVFPSPHHSHPDYGVKFVAVDGTYQGRRNFKEACSIIDDVIALMKKRKTQSIGIVALNQQQRDLIKELFEQKTNSDPAVREYLAQWENTLEPFFVKNLENVQGDERDIIVVSTVYGKDQDGAFHLRFGPINGAMGHRRLNVLFTRAKYQLKVFSSIDPDKLTVNETSALGLKAFKGYLHYAKDGILTQPEYNSNRGPDSEFEIAVRQGLEGLGYSVVSQLGVAGFFMDLAIQHPEKPGIFILGVECDGATYHSAKSARDRDRIRQEILEQLGWRLHRIWSVDWFRNPMHQLERIQSKIKEIVGHETTNTSTGMLRAASIKSDYSTATGSSKAGEEFNFGNATSPETSHIVSKSENGKDQLMEALRECVDEASLACRSCTDTREIWIGRHGPFFKCRSMQCGKTESLPLPALAKAIDSLNVNCPSCGKHVTLAQAPQGTFIGCSAYPICKKAISWKDFRHNLRAPTQ